MDCYSLCVIIPITNKQTAITLNFDEFSLILLILNELLGMIIIHIAILTLLSVICIISAETDEIYRVKFTVNLGKEKTDYFIIEVHNDWAPIGSNRFYELLNINYFNGNRFFRVISGFMAQFGIHGDPKISSKWKERTIKHSRTTQLFINFNDNTNLDEMGFTPFAVVIEGMNVVDQLYAIGEGGQGDGKDKKGPSQGRIQEEGNKYLKKVFPKLSYIISTEILPKDENEELKVNQNNEL